MSRLIQKTGFIKPGSASNYMTYIAKREGAEILPGTASPTAPQKKLISQLLKEFPDSKDSFEYEDYLHSPTISSASAFISITMDTHMNEVQHSSAYMKYIATRPGAELHGEHGLFGAEPSVNLKAAISEAESYPGNIWTIIYSLRRADAVRFGYETAEAWRRLILKHSAQLAEAMRIDPQDFCWYGAFHNKDGHPHIHLMVWSRNPAKGYLTKDGIAKMRSILTNDIFDEDLHTLYVQKDIAYKELTSAARLTLEDLLHTLDTQLYSSPKIAQKMIRLSDALRNTPGKKVYGYLPATLKDLVNSITDELSAVPTVAEAYSVWYQLKQDIARFYQNEQPPCPPLSEQRDLRHIKNMIISEAQHISNGRFTFEDEDMDDDGEPYVGDEGPPPRRELWSHYRSAAAVIRNLSLPREARTNALCEMETLWDQGLPAAAHFLGRLYRDGQYVPLNRTLAQEWFLKASSSGYADSQYALGKMLLRQRPQEAIRWMEAAAAQKNRNALYTLGKIYLTGTQAPKDLGRALMYLQAAASSGHSYAQYTLGKLLLDGKVIPQNRNAAKIFFQESAAQGNQYAAFFLSHLDTISDPSVFLAATRLIHQFSNIIRNNSVPPGNPCGFRIDSKRRRKLAEKRLAAGHKKDDHEEIQRYQQTM